MWSLKIDEDTQKIVIEDAFKKGDENPFPIKQGEHLEAIIEMHGKANPQNTSLFDFWIMLDKIIPKFVSAFEEHGVDLTFN